MATNHDKQALPMPRAELNVRHSHARATVSLSRPADLSARPLPPARASRQLELECPRRVESTRRGPGRLERQLPYRAPRLAPGFLGRIRERIESESSSITEPARARLGLRQLIASHLSDDHQLEGSSAVTRTRRAQARAPGGDPGTRTTLRFGFCSGGYAVPLQPEISLA